MNQPENSAKGVSRRTIVKGLVVGVALTVLGTEDSSYQNRTEKVLNKYFNPPGVLHRWVYERNALGKNLNSREGYELEWTLFLERNARKEIVEALKTDVIRWDNSQPEDTNRAYLDARDSMKRIGTNADIKVGKAIRIPKKDSVTGESYEVKIDRGFDDLGRYYRAQEVRPDGSLISEAVIHENGGTSLTLDFSGPRYAQANPKIIKETRFSKAAIKTFNLLVGSVLK